ncbi:MAG: antitoxin [Acidimicrobiales bacterium]
MGLFDKAKGLLGQHGDKVEGAIDKVADTVDEKTGGKYADQIDKGAEAAKGFVDGDGEHVAGGDEGDQEPPSRHAP